MNLDEIVQRNEDRKDCVNTGGLAADVREASYEIVAAWPDWDAAAGQLAQQEQSDEAWMNEMHDKLDAVIGGLVEQEVRQAAADITALVDEVKRLKRIETAAKDVLSRSSGMFGNIHDGKCSLTFEDSTKPVNERLTHCDCVWGRLRDALPPDPAPNDGEAGER